MTRMPGTIEVSERDYIEMRRTYDALLQPLKQLVAQYDPPYVFVGHPSEYWVINARAAIRDAEDKS
jgi:hypothetical protein